MGLHSQQQLKHYKIKDKIASGGMGEVWRAWDEENGKNVAIKAISNDLFMDINFRNRFLDEIRRHIKLSHPNIVGVLDVFTTADQNCLVMELIDSRSLTDILKKSPQNRLKILEALPIMYDLLAALNYAHEHGIIHRDVKPSNVLIENQTGRAYLIDFGIALAVGEDRRTKTGQTVGTPHYMSPEQIVNPKTIDHRSDVYSAGCLFYEMLTGRPPFIADKMGSQDSTEFALKKAHVSEKPLSPKERVQTIPKHISDVIMFALEKKPENRLPGCKEFIRLLSEEKRHTLIYSIRFNKVYVFGMILFLLWLLFLASFFVK